MRDSKAFMYVAGLMAFHESLRVAWPHPTPGNAVETFKYPSTRKVLFK